MCAFCRSGGTRRLPCLVGDLSRTCASRGHGYNWSGAHGAEVVLFRSKGVLRAAVLCCEYPAHPAEPSKTVSNNRSTTKGDLISVPPLFLRAQVFVHPGRVRSHFEQSLGLCVCSLQERRCQIQARPADLWLRLGCERILCQTREGPCAGRTQKSV